MSGMASEENVVDIGNDVLADLFEGGYVEGDIGNNPSEGVYFVEEGGRLRDSETGQFVSAQSAVPTPVGETPEATPESTEATVSEPEVAETAPEATADDTSAAVEETDELAFELPADHVLFTKYGGDIDKALAALEDSQSFIGRQADELGELRALREEMTAFKTDVSSQIQSSQIDWEALISESPKDAAEIAVQLGDPRALQASVEAWAEESPFQAMMFMNELAAAAADEAAGQKPSVPETSFEAEMDALKGKYPDLQQLLPAITSMAAERPMLAAALSPQGNPRDRAQALEDLYHLAKSRTIESDTSSAHRRVILRAAKAAETARAEAVVVGATNTSAAEAAPVPTEDEILQARLRDLTGLNDLVVV